MEPSSSEMVGQKREFRVVPEPVPTSVRLNFVSAYTKLETSNHSWLREKERKSEKIRESFLDYIFIQQKVSEKTMKK